MYINNKILVGKSEKIEANLLLTHANRHGLITGASGTGKTITLKVLAESFSDAGVPVFFSDVKGDLAGCCLPGEESDSLKERLNNLKIDNFEYKSYPVTFWDLYAKEGIPIRTTVSSIGPNILSIMLGLSEVQEGVLDIVFKIAEDEDIKLDDLKDLKSILQYIGDNRKDYITKYGNITTQSIGVIQRSLLSLQNQGVDKFFGFPELDIKDFITTNNEGRGMINILHAVELFKNPDLYAAFMLWFLTELFNKMPEVGDLDKPKIVFFFDEAHLLFNEIPSYRLKQITQVVKLIRSRAIGLYFFSQKPTDIPDSLIGQLGNRVQHALRAYTPAELKIVKTAAEAFRVNPSFDTEKEITNLGTGEALVSFQNENGEPEIVQKVTILPPQSKMGIIDEMTRTKIINNSILINKYTFEAGERESAYEEIKKRNEEKQKQIDEEKFAKEEAKRLKEEEKAKRQAEREKKNNPIYKTGRRVASRVEGRLITKAINAIFKALKK